MLIGVPKEIKNHEYRVGLIPESVAELVARGHQVVVETQAGMGIGATNHDYQDAGADVAASADEIFTEAEMIVKVKEPQAVERAKLRAGQILYTYLHLAPDPEQTKDLVNSGAVCIAYETVTDAADVPGVAPGKVVVIGGGVVGFNAAQMAVGNHADVTILDRNPAALERLEHHFEASAKVIYSTRATLEKLVAEADLVVGAVLIPGAAAPKLVTREMLSTMQDGAVIVDVAIDQGGCFETSKATTHQEPTYVVDGVVHYCVANMLGAVARTSTYALNNVTLQHAPDLR